MKFFPYAGISWLHYSINPEPKADYSTFGAEEERSWERVSGYSEGSVDNAGMAGGDLTASPVFRHE